MFKEIYYRSVLYILLVYNSILLHYFKDTRVYYCIIYYDVVIFFSQKLVLGWQLDTFFRGRPQRYNQSLQVRVASARNIERVLQCRYVYHTLHTHNKYISKVYSKTGNHFSYISAQAARSVSRRKRIRPRPLGRCAFIFFNNICVRVCMSAPYIISCIDRQQRAEYDTGRLYCRRRRLLLFARRRRAKNNWSTAATARYRVI